MIATPLIPNEDDTVINKDIDINVGNSGSTTPKYAEKTYSVMLG